MPSYTTPFLPHFDFTPALALSPLERMRARVALAEAYVLESGAAELLVSPPTPPQAASDGEIVALEQQLGVALPDEYRLFLDHWRYLSGGGGCEVWGFDDKGGSIGTPWVSDRHRSGYQYLVCGAYWHDADGDHVMIDLTTSDMPVVPYLHEHRGLIEYFAPTFSLAVWRMVHG